MFTGNEFGMRYNSFALFKVPIGNWKSARLTTTPGYTGSGGPNLIQFFDAHINLDDLINQSHIGVDAFNDLGNGAFFGQAVMHDTTVSAALSQAFLDEANAVAGSYMLIGFTNATLNGLPSGADQDDGIYINGVGPALAPIVLTLSDVNSAVPEPASWAMMVGGIGMVGGTMRRRRLKIGFSAA
jgi:hypothetical protein